MLPVHLDRLTGLRQVLCVGAHCDDIEIGCGGTLRELTRSNPHLVVHWVIFSSSPQRAEEARASATELLEFAGESSLQIHDFRDGFLPHVGAQVKENFEKLKTLCAPDLIFTHQRDDLHQDHRLVAELTWNTFRDHWILEYEIPKYDGDLGRPGVFVPLSPAACEAKVDQILRHFRSQAGKPWFCRETFLGLMRLRGMECNADSGYAEAYFCRKLVLAAERRRGT